MGVADPDAKMLLSPCFLEEDYALAFPSSYHFSRLPPSGVPKHERSKSAPLKNDFNGHCWDISSPVMHWASDHLDSKRKHRQALEQDVLLLQMRLQQEQETRASLEKALVNASSCLSPSCQSIASKARDLIAETALIEREVAHLEQRVLWLYRQILTKPATTTEEHHDQTQKVFKFVRKKPNNLREVMRSPVFPEENVLKSSSSRGRSFSSRLSATSSPVGKASPLHQFLAAIQPKPQAKLSEMPLLETKASSIYNSLEFAGTPNELSEALVRIMVNIFYKLADLPLSSPSPMLSSSTSGSSSPVVGGLLLNPFQLNKQAGDSGAYRFMVEVPWISVDSNQLAFAAQSLHEFKILVKQLSSIDPASMESDEKLAFWINVYNALVMHAHLAYGIPNSRSKRESLLQKAAYKVGNDSLNALTIAQCVLGCRSDPQSSNQWFQVLLSPLTRAKRDDRSAYGLPTPEPLVCFGLCSGARSDPAVRVYTASNVRNQLRVAKAEFLQASIGVGAKQSVMLPRVLEGFLSEAGVSSRSLLQWLCHNLPEQHSLVVRNCFKRTRSCEWLPYNYSFRYIFARELVEGLTLY